MTEIKFVRHRRVEGKIKTLMIIKERSGQWYACGYTQDRDVNAVLNVRYRGSQGNTSLNENMISSQFDDLGRYEALASRNERSP